jgi:hypothetical protein
MIIWLVQCFDNFLRFDRFIRVPPGRSMYATQHRSPSDGQLRSRIKAEPFQIFCLRNRRDVAQLNPHLSFFEVTSVLGRLWRGLTLAQKSEYVDFAKSVGGTTFTVDVVISSIGDLSHGVQLVQEQSPTGIQKDISWPMNPQYSIVPRGTSGIEAARASQALLRRADED